MQKRILVPAGILFTILLSCIILVAKDYSSGHSDSSDIQKSRYEPMEGDIIFQSSVSPQCEAIKQATKSTYTHCGIVFKQDGKWMVIEAVQPVSINSFEKFVDRGEHGHFVIKRLKNREKILTESVLRQMRAQADAYLGKNYDATFEWDDEKIYCSELVWKVYKTGANVEVGILQKLRNFELSSPLVQKTLNERYGKNIPLDETVIAPSSIYESPELITVFTKK